MTYGSAKQFIEPTSIHSAVTTNALPVPENKVILRIKYTRILLHERINNVAGRSEVNFKYFKKNAVSTTT